MLEQPRKTGVKVISHMLASHGGEIFIHILPTSRSILEDPPPSARDAVAESQTTESPYVAHTMLLDDGLVVFFR